MTAPRLTSDFWVQAYIARLRIADIPAFLVARGDATAGAVLVKLNTLNGRAKLHGRVLGPDWTPVWSVLADGPEADVDAAVARQRRSDPDLWLIEVEDRLGRTLLDEPGLA
ncbi:MAG: hypothetical protein ACJAVR_002989 [Paracoccaceae bacterium]|jgi:hypothetical protein